MKCKYIAIALLFFLFAYPKTGQSLPLIIADKGDPPAGDSIFNMCSLGCSMGWQVDSSSNLSPQNGNNYSVTKLDDSRVSTAWVEGVDSYGIGEKITFTFNKKHFGVGPGKCGDPEKYCINFNGFRFINGYLKNKNVWEKNSRVKKVRVYLNKKPIYDIHFHDSMTVQTARSESVYIEPGDKIIVEITEIYPGQVYKDTAISELVPLGAH